MSRSDSESTAGNPSEEASPYPGLRPFREEDSLYFFGRDEQVDQLLGRLAKKRFLAVVGTSGSGKSSLIYAGLIPAMKTGLMGSPGARWVFAKMRPGDRPFWRLAEALLDPSVLGEAWSDDEHSTAAVHATLQRGPLGLKELLDETPIADDHKLLLIVDQFEELFRYQRQGVDQRDEANAFVALLLATIQDNNLPIYIVLTMRSDYLGDCALFEGLPEALNDSQFLTPKLSREQRRQAILGPAIGCGADVERSLVNRLLNDMGTGGDRLPLMQHVLMRLWKHAELTLDGEKILRLASYEAIGGLDGALSGHANDVYDRLAPSQKRITETLFRRLCDRAPDGRDTRRPSRIDEIAKVAMESSQSVIEVVDIYRQSELSFLIPHRPQPIRSTDTIDISHEILIRQWDKLREWVREEASWAETYQRIAQTAKLWDLRRAGPWRSPELEIAQHWMNTAKPNEAWAERYRGQVEDRYDYRLVEKFLRESLAAQVQEQAEKAARQWRLIEEQERSRVAEARLADADRISIAQEAQLEAEESLRRETEHKLQQEAARRAAEKELRLQIEAQFEKEIELHATETKLFQETQLREREQLEAAEKSRRQSRVSRRFAWAASLAACVAAVLFLIARRANERAEKALIVVTAQRLSFQSQAVFNSSPNLGLLLAIEANRLAPDVSITEETFRRQLAQVGGKSFLEKIDGPIDHLAFSPDGNVVAIISHKEKNIKKPENIEEPRNTQFLYFFDVTKRTRLYPKPAVFDASTVAILSFSLDSKKLVVGSFERKSAFVWTWSLEESMVTLSKNKEVGKIDQVTNYGAVTAIAINPDGRSLALGFNDIARNEAGILVIDIESLKIVNQELLHFPKQSFSGLAFHPNGKSLAAGSYSGDVYFWSDYSLRSGVQLSGDHDAQVTSIAFSPDGKQLLTAGADNAIKMWTFTGNTVSPTVVQRIYGGRIRTGAISPNGKRFVTAGDDGNVAIWDLSRANDPPRFIRGTGGSIAVATFSSDGKLVTAGEDGQSRIWDLDQPVIDPMIYQWADPRRQEKQAAFSGAVFVGPNSDQTVIAMFNDESFRIWNPQKLGNDEVIHGLFRRPDDLSRNLDSFQMRAGIRKYQNRHQCLFVVADGMARFKATTTTETTVSTLGDPYSPFGALAVSHGGRHLATVRDGTLALWTTDSLKQSVATGKVDLLGNLTGEAVFSPNDRWLAIGRSLKAAALPSNVKSVGPSAGTNLKKSHQGKFVQIFDLLDLEKKPIDLVAEATGVYTLTFSPDSRLLAAATRRNTQEESVLVWKIENSDAPLASFRLKSGIPDQLAFSPDGRYLATASRTRDLKSSVRIDNIKRIGEDTVRLPLPVDSCIVSLAFTSDGNYLTAGTSNGTAIYWTMKLDELIRQVGATIVHQNLSVSEWKQYLPGMKYQKTFDHLPVPTDDADFNSKIR